MSAATPSTLPPKDSGHEQTVATLQNELNMWKAQAAAAELQLQALQDPARPDWLPPVEEVKSIVFPPPDPSHSSSAGDQGVRVGEGGRPIWHVWQRTPDNAGQLFVSS